MDSPALGYIIEIIMKFHALVAQNVMASHTYRLSIQSSRVAPGQLYILVAYSYKQVHSFS